MIPSPDILPCGCVLTYAIVDGVKTMTVAPCTPGCDRLQWIRDEAALQGKPVQERRA